MKLPRLFNGLFCGLPGAGLVLLLACSGSVSADANQGDFMGYRLGQNYQLTAGTDKTALRYGSTRILAEEPVKPQDMGEVFLITTPMTYNIGVIEARQLFDTREEARIFGKRYLELLHAKYPEWALGEEGLDANMLINEVSLLHKPYRITARLYSPAPETNSRWAITIVLGYAQETVQRRAWLNLVEQEQKESRQSQQQQILEQADTQGL
jgi:hypothetical protein